PPPPRPPHPRVRGAPGGGGRPPHLAAWPGAGRRRAARPPAHQRRSLTMGDDDFTRLPDLASRRLGGSGVYPTGARFAEGENLYKPGAPAYSTYTFGHKGQVYDGW